MDDDDLFLAMQRILAVSGQVLVVGDDVASNDIVGQRYVLVDLESPVTARLFSSMDELQDEVEEVVQRSLNALGGRRYVDAIRQGDLERDEFLALGGDRGETWLARGEKAVLGYSLDKAVGAGDAPGAATVAQRTRL